jgi:flagellar motor switch protein FliM
METDWVKADFTTASQWEGAAADQLRLANEALARDLAMNLSAFLRTSVNVRYAGAAKVAFSGCLEEEQRSCFASVLTRPMEHKLVLRTDYDLLFPLIGIALGAKAGAFASPARKPTEIELQVATLLFRVILTEAFRAWAPLIHAQLEPLAVEVEQTPSRVLPGGELMCTTEFEISAGESSGKLILAAPAGLFANVLNVLPAPSEVAPDPTDSSSRVLSLMMSAQVSVEIWLESADIRLGDLLQLQAGQIVKLDHAAEHRVLGTLNGKNGFAGQIVSTGARRGFLIEETLD